MLESKLVGARQHISTGARGSVPARSVYRTRVILHNKSCCGQCTEGYVVGPLMRTDTDNGSFGNRS